MSILLLASFLPLVIFALVNHKINLKSGVFSSFATSLLLAAFIFYTTGNIGSEIYLMVASLLAFGLYAIRCDSSFVFKLQPAFSNWVTAVFLGWYQLKEGSFFRSYLPKMKNLLDEKQLSLLQGDLVLEHLDRASSYAIVTLLFHGIWVVWAAKHKTVTVWLVVKALFIPMFFVVFLIGEWMYSNYS